MALTTTPDQARLILEDEDTELEVSDAREFTFIGWNTRRPQLSDQRVRQALAMAIDRQGLVETLLRGEGVNEEYGRVAETGVPPYHWAHDANLRGPAYDTVAAREQLARAGWRDRDGDGVRENVQGVPLRLEILVSAGNATRETVAGFVEAQLGKVGVEVDVQPREPTELARRVTGAEVRDFDGVVLAWVPEFRVDEKNLFHSAREQGPMAFAGIRDVELDALLDTLPLISDREEALPLWSAYQERIIDLQPFTYLFYPRKLVGRSSRLDGVEVDYRGELLTVHDWRKADADGR
jgi:peptide/nickel transport system substrate-binding protein